jgi:DNA-binding response OmpR family regulator
MLEKTGKCPCCGQPMPLRDIAVDLNSNRLMVGDKQVRLKTRLAEVLSVLIDGWPETVTRERISIRVWGLYLTPSEKTIETHIWSARKILRPFGWTVKSQYGVGYRLARL